MLRKESKWNHTKFSIKTHKRQKKSKENVYRPKRAKRKLYTNEISSPIDISGQVVSYYLSFLKSKTVYVPFNSEVLITI